MDERKLLALALLGGGAYLAYKGAKGTGLLTTPTGLAPYPPTGSAPQRPYVPYVPPQGAPPTEQIAPYQEPHLPAPPSGLSLPDMLRQFYSYLDLYSRYREREYKMRYQEILPQLMVQVGEKTKDQCLTPDLVHVLVSRYLAGRIRDRMSTWGGDYYFDSAVFYDRQTGAKYEVEIYAGRHAGNVSHALDRIMDPNESMAEVLSLSMEVAERYRIPAEALLLPTWDAWNIPRWYARGVPSSFLTHYRGIGALLAWMRLGGWKYLLQPGPSWIRYWVSRWNYLPRYVTNFMPLMPRRQYGNMGRNWLIIEPNRRPTAKERQRILQALTVLEGGKNLAPAVETLNVYLR